MIIYFMKSLHLNIHITNNNNNTNMLHNSNKLVKKKTYSSIIIEGEKGGL
jgi:hypothetical protein